VKSLYVGIVIIDIPTGAQNRPNRRDTWREIPESRSSGYQGFGVVKLLHNGIAIRDFPTRSEPFDVRDACPRIQGSRGSAFRGFRRQRNRRLKNRDISKRDFPITIGVWAPGARTEDRWQLYRGSGN
jgi:hypothetical protein